MVLFHELCSLLDGCPHRHSCGWESGQDRLQCRTGHFLSNGLNILDDLLRLAGAHLCLYALQRIVELAGRAVGALQLLHGIVEALCDVENSSNVVVLVHDGQVTEAFADHEV